MAKAKLLEKLWPDILTTVDRRISGEEHAIVTAWDHVNFLLGDGFWAGAHTLISTSGNGKTTFAMQCAIHAALAEVPTFYASLELDNAQIGLRAASCLDDSIRWNDALRGKRTQRKTLDWVFEEQIQGLPLWIDVGQNDGWDLEELETWILKRREEGYTGTLFAVIDYLQLVKASGQDERSSIKTIMRQIQNLARLQNVAILAISSTSRANYGEADVLEAAELLGTSNGNTGQMKNRSIVMKMAKEAGEIEYGSTTLSALVRDYSCKRTYLLIAKRRIEDGGVWCSFEWKGTGFVEDQVFAISGKNKSDPDDLYDFGDI